jgi:hypothetical protein
MTAHLPPRSEGVPFWDAKLAMIRAVLPAYSNGDVIEKLYPGLANDENAGRVEDNLRKWREHYPRKRSSFTFFEIVAKSLGCPSHIDAKMIVDSNVDQFISYLPPEKQQKARLALSAKGVGLAESAFSGGADARNALHRRAEDTDLPVPAVDSRIVWLGADLRFEPITVGIRAGRINMAHYYLAPDAADEWMRLIRAEGYPTYDQCKEGLRRLFQRKLWNEALIESAPRTAVMLAGGGAPSKDVVLLRHMLAQPYNNDAIRYFLVDISIYMLHNSMRWLSDNLSAIRGHERIDIRRITCDVLDMRQWRQDFRRTGTVIFGMTGGTIGNLSEKAFFSSLNSVSDEGDLLILSADTIDDIPDEEVEGILAGKYDNEDMHIFLAPVVRAVHSELEMQGSTRDLLKQVKFRLRQGKAERVSDVENSRSVILSIEANGKDVTLVSSTRYKSSSLKDFASARGWEFVDAAPSPMNPHYVQFCFRKRSLEKSGKS